MNYNGKNIEEADGKDYPLSLTTKRMLVWDNGQYSPFERDVLGFFQGFWVAADNYGKGVCQWLHAAEIPKQPTIADYLKELHRNTGNYPYVVHPNSRPITKDEEYAIDVPERSLLLYIHHLVEPSNTFVVLPGCSETVKTMFRVLNGYHRIRAPHADIVFIGKEVAE